MKDSDKLSVIVDSAIERYHGRLGTLEQAIGMLYVGHRFGWKPLLLIHNKRTIRSYEKILNIKMKEEFPEIGEAAERSIAWGLAKKTKNFWKAVSGETPGFRSADIKKSKLDDTLTGKKSGENGVKE